MGSLKARSSDDSPRGLGFMLNRNRMNVVISRAKRVVHLVHSPDTLMATFSSLEDVKCVTSFAVLPKVHARLMNLRAICPPT